MPEEFCKYWGTFYMLTFSKFVISKTKTKYIVCCLQVSSELMKILILYVSEAAHVVC